MQTQQMFDSSQMLVNADMSHDLVTVTSDTEGSSCD